MIICIRLLILLLWPDNIIYDPDTDGILIASLGVHEHWNDSINKQYTRNLVTGNGIELFKVHEENIGITEINKLKISVYPNPTKDYVRISNLENKTIAYSLVDLSGKVLLNGIIKNKAENKINLTSLNNGVYVLNFYDSNKKKNIKIIKH